MKGVAFLALFAFVAGFLPNHVEGKGKCYACGGASGYKSCEEFEKASVDGKKAFIKETPLQRQQDDVDFVKNNETSTMAPKSRRRRAFGESGDCSRCSKFNDGGKTVLRNCAQNKDKSTNDGKWFVCEGGLCNGAGSLASWASVAILATVVSLLKGSRF